MENFIQVNGTAGANEIDLAKWKLVGHNPASDTFTFCLRAKEVKATTALDTGHLQEIVNDLQDLEVRIQGIISEIEHYYHISPKEL